MNRPFRFHASTRILSEIADDSAIGYLSSMTTALVVLAVLLFVATAILIATHKFVSMLTRPKLHSHEESRAFLKGNGIDCAALESSHRHEGFSFDSPRGYTLRGIIIHHDLPSSPKTDIPEKRKAVVIVHGYTGNYSSMYPYAKMMLDCGFDVVLYDHRAHGTSDRRDSKGRRICCSMGRYEVQDLVDLFGSVCKRFGDDCEWGFVGESMGGAIVMQAAHLIPRLSFVIEDCGYSSMEKEAKAVFRSLHLPSWPTMQLGDARLSRRWGWRLEDIDATKALKHTDVPMLFCHGDADTFVPTAMVHEVYGAKPDRKVLHLYEGSTHARSILDHPVEYEANVRAFLDGFGL